MLAPSERRHGSAREGREPSVRLSGSASTIASGRLLCRARRAASAVPGRLWSGACGPFPRCCERLEALELGAASDPERELLETLNELAAEACFESEQGVLS